MADSFSVFNVRQTNRSPTRELLLSSSPNPLSMELHPTSHDPPITRVDLDPPSSNQVKSVGGFQIDIELGQDTDIPDALLFKVQIPALAIVTSRDGLQLIESSQRQVQCVIM